MNMKWNPINDGDLSEIPKYTEFLFTIVDEDDGESYTTVGEVRRGIGNLLEVVSWYGVCKAENVKAWMEPPEPYVPGMCGICKHWRVWIDGSGNRWSKCELMGIATFVPLKCPLKK